MSISTNDINKFSKYCETNFLNEISIYKQSTSQYQSLSVCILDCVYSLQASYSCAKNVVQNYADYYLNGVKDSPNDTLDDFIDRIGSNATDFATTILKNNQKLAKQCKASICKELARKLYELLNINTLNDFKTFPKQKIELLEIVIKSVNGIKDAATNYLFMLAGDPNRCKPDVHILHCVRDAIGKPVSSAECQSLFSASVSKLISINPNLTVAALDHIIWEKYST